MGVINYYGRFIDNQADKAKPIYDLLKEKKKWAWNLPEQRALNKVKEAITRRDALAPFETSSKRAVRVTCYASEVGMGAVLEQEQEDCIFKPVLYWSSQFRKYEANYSIAEKEALACVAATQKLRKYLLGRSFILRTDHKALVTLLSQVLSKRTESRIERWREKLSYFDYIVEYIQGQNNQMADWLFRSAGPVDHEEIPLKEEFVINEILRRHGGQVPEYSAELMKVTRAIMDDD